jgi:hypothetical protein
MFAGCSIFNDANRAGIDLDVGLDGILSQAAGVHLTFTAAAERKETGNEKGRAPGGRRDRGSL